jgi:hypothetical protein
MAFAASALTGVLSKKWSIGPVKIEIQSCTCASGDTSGTVAAKTLSSVFACLVISGLKLTSVPSISGTTATLAFADPVATVAGHVILIGV